MTDGTLEMGVSSTFTQTRSIPELAAEHPGGLGIAIHFVEQSRTEGRAEKWPLVWWTLTVMYPDDVHAFDAWHDVLWDLVHLSSWQTTEMRRDVLQALADRRMVSWARRELRVLREASSAE